ncbi:hypothetical protein BpHYR1_032109 [Brachionus plicatilis]|uniref:Uncharacterized protein n=1 Tax=Brachionus plicatilis TaxID=10195 RepID=A0A3M7RC07_BRAPC|nr:hypothetical protein BpHYR1_032109 [Brachionus plicatilis]
MLFIYHNSSLFEIGLKHRQLTESKFLNIKKFDSLFHLMSLNVSYNVQNHLIKQPEVTASSYKLDDLSFSESNSDG